MSLEIETKGFLRHNRTILAHEIKTLRKMKKDGSPAHLVGYQSGYVDGLRHMLNLSIIDVAGLNIELEALKQTQKDFR